MIKYQYYIVRKDNLIRNENLGDVIRGYWTFRAPFHPTDMSKTYVLNGYAIGKKARDDMLKKDEIRKITKKEAVETLLHNLR